MTVRPILFSAPMIRAILDGRKTQTRRVVKPQPDNDAKITIGELGTSRGVAYIGNLRSGGIVTRVPCPYGQPGDRLWVRETWQEFFDDEIPEGRTRSVRGRMGIPAEPERLSYVAFRADGEMPDHPIAGKANWRPSIHMPRWASRITLEITAVRVERLQDISEQDAIAEGAPTEITKFGLTVRYRSRRDAFIELWDSINFKSAPWSLNPWVWVVSFRRIEQ